MNDKLNKIMDDVLNDNTTIFEGLVLLTDLKCSDIDAFKAVTDKEWKWEDVRSDTPLGILLMDMAHITLGLQPELTADYRKYLESIDRKDLIERLDRP
jgi:hypothetical protein